MKFGEPERKERSDMFGPRADSRLKALLRKTADHTVARRRAAIDLVLDAFIPKECPNSFAAAGCGAG
jgi:hypothetical protein